MGILATDIRECVIIPVLQYLDLWSGEKDPAIELLMLTAAQESGMGTYLQQIDGPAFGIYQMESGTHKDVWRYLKNKPMLRGKVTQFMSQRNFNDEELIWNLAYATAICRVKYYMVPEPIPETLTGLAKYWKQYYNTQSGKGTIDEAIKNYTKYVYLK